MRCFVVGCLTSQQHASVSPGRIWLTSQQHASVSQGRICLMSQQHASVSQGRICLTSQQHASGSQGRIYLTSQQHASVSQGRICSDNVTCCHTETEVTDQTFYLTQSQYTDTGPTSPSAAPIPASVAWQGSPWSANLSLVWLDPEKNSQRKRSSNSGSLQSPRCVTNCLQHVHSSGQGTIVWQSRATHLAPITYNTSSAYHVQHI